MQLKARALLAMFQDRSDHLDFAIEAAVGEAKSKDHACDEALALSIARDVLAA